jgi:hypothetical protein
MKLYILAAAIGAIIGGAIATVVALLLVVAGGR